MKKKVLYICESLSGGVRKHLIDILLNINVNYYEPYLIYSSIRTDLTFIDNIIEIKKKGIQIFEVNMVRQISVLNDLNSLIKIIRIINQIKPDIVHCHSSKAGAIGRIASKICGVKKIIYTPHGYYIQRNDISKIKRFIYKSIERLLSKLTTLTINVSYGENNIGLKNKIINYKNSVVIKNGITDIDITRINKVKSRIIIGTTGRLETNKDPFTFYNIAKNLVKKYKNVIFIYIGDGPCKVKIQNQIEKDNVDRILLLGFKKNVDNWLRIMDIFLMTSLHEALPYSIIEALAHSLPIVATNVTGINELVIDNYNGFLFNNSNVFDGVRKLELLINDKDLRLEFSKNSYILYKNEYTLDNMLNNLYKVYS